MVKDRHCQLTAEPVFLSDVRRSNHKRRRSFRDRSTIVKQAKSPSSEGNVHVHDMAEVLGNVKQFLVKRLRFSAEEASVYVAGLEEGTVTSVSLGKKVSLRPATVLGILRRLMDRGLFLSSLDDGSGKGHAVHYVAIQPEEAFRKNMNGSRQTSTFCRSILTFRQRLETEVMKCTCCEQSRRLSPGEQR